MEKPDQHPHLCDPCWEQRQRENNMMDAPYIVRDSFITTQAIAHGGDIEGTFGIISDTYGIERRK